MTSTECVKARTSRLIGCALLWLFSTSAAALGDTVTVEPSFPDETASIVIQVAGHSPFSRGYYFKAYSIQGSVLTILACEPLVGFSTPSPYEFPVNVGPLPAGKYTINYSTAPCFPGTTDFAFDPQLRVTTTFIVALPFAIPAVEPIWLALLAALLLLVGGPRLVRR